MILLLASTNRAPPYLLPHPLLYSIESHFVPRSLPLDRIIISAITTQAHRVRKPIDYSSPTHFFFCDFKLLKVCFVFKFINTPTRPPLLSHYANQFMLLWILVFPLLDSYLCLCLFTCVCVCLGVSSFQVVYTFRLVTLMVYLISFAAAAHPSYKNFGCDVARGRNFQYNIIFGQSLNCFFNDGSAVSFLLPHSPYFNIIPI